MIKVSDFIIDFLAKHNAVGDCVFMVSGGGNMHLIDSLGENKQLNYMCNHHEQACTIAAEAYARVTNKIGVSFVTTGPGATNAVTGVFAAWVDSIPTLTISGQVKLETTMAYQSTLNLRQLGDQEVNVVALVKSITKYAVMITDKNSVKYHLQKAVYEAKKDRPGPVWLDIPLDIQGAMVDEERLVEFLPEQVQKYDNRIDKVISLLKKVKRPVIIAGNGIALSNANQEFLNLIEKLQIPVVGTFARYDIIHDDHPYAFGRYGTIGHRATNFIVQNSDFVLAIGARMNIRSISYNWEFFARDAVKISVDIDKAELDKNTLKLDLKINSDAMIFINALREKELDPSPYKAWVKRCVKYKKDFPTITKERINITEYVDSYNFFNVLSDVASDNAVFVFANATASVSSFQSLKTKGTQRVLENSGCAAMGYDLPAAIGACVANDFNDVICVTGDGSLQLNLQELQTILHYKLPIKLFVLNNGGYASIRNTQNTFFNGRKIGSDKESGVSFPDTIKVAEAYGYRTFQIKNHVKLHDKLIQILNTNGSLVCEIMLDPDERMEPKLSSEIKKDGSIVSKPLEDMYPFLDRGEFYKNMINKPIKE